MCVVPDGLETGWSKELLESLFDAVVDLKRSLRLLGSDLAILTGRTADVLSPLAQKVLIRDRCSLMAKGHNLKNRNEAQCIDGIACGL